MINVLYISYDGLTDPLGQSQIIPYLAGLSEEGFRIHVISCEKKRLLAEHKSSISALLEKNQIMWHPVLYTKSPPVLSTVIDLIKMRKKISELIIGTKFDIVHCRSYIASLIGIELKNKYGLAFIFDMRGFWADERVDGKIWNLKNPLYYLIYLYFKRKEKQFLSKADAVISLTEAAKKEIHSWTNIPSQPIPIEVIPCCVDMRLFNKDLIDREKTDLLKADLKILPDEFIVSYLGSIGTWYLLDEMLIFFKMLLRLKPGSKFLIITPDNPSIIRNKALNLNIPAERVIIRKVNRESIPLYISISSVSVFFIKPCFSKKASSPVKFGEVLAMGVPVICNDIGDIKNILAATKGGILVERFDEKTFCEVARQAGSVNMESVPDFIAENMSLKKGVAMYKKVYSDAIATSKLKKSTSR